MVWFLSLDLILLFFFWSVGILLLPFSGNVRMLHILCVMSDSGCISFCVMFGSEKTFPVMEVAH